MDMNPVPTPAASQEDPVPENNPGTKKRKKKKKSVTGVILKILIWVVVIAVVIFLTLFLSSRIAEFESISAMLVYIREQLSS